MEDKNHRSDGKEDKNSHQKPAAEPLPQIDLESTPKVAERKSEINESDERDRSDSTTDWDAEQSRTSRHK